MYITATEKKFKGPILDSKYVLCLKLINNHFSSKILFQNNYYFKNIKLKLIIISIVLIK